MNSHIINRRLLVVFWLGFSSGLPFALTAGTLQAWYTLAGVDIVTIGLLSLAWLPYLFKFLWAPLMDWWIPPLGGRRRGWIFITQVLLIAALIAMALFNPATHPYQLAILAFVVVFFSASQDIAIDAYRTDILPASERGMGAAMAVAGYRLAIFVSGGAALIFAQHYGFVSTYLLMALCLATGLIATYLGPQPKHDIAKQDKFSHSVIEPFKELFSRPQIITLLVFIALFKLGETFTSSTGNLMTTFLLREVGFSLTAVGTVNKGIGLTATIVGVFLGGLLLIRVSLFRALLVFGLLQAITNLGFMWLAIKGHSLPLLILCVGLDNLSAGLGTAGIVALLMRLCHPHHTATQFALLSAVSALPRVVFGPLGGYLLTYVSWAQFFFVTFLIALPAVGLLLYLRQSLPLAEEEDNNSAMALATG